MVIFFMEAVMFGYIRPHIPALRVAEYEYYRAIYCGICRAIRDADGQLCRLGLSYDMVFLALLLTSLYEPEEFSGQSRCIAHPAKRRPWADNEYIRYAARMNVALACYNFLDDWNDDGKMSAKLLSEVFGRAMPRIREEYPRQCVAMEQSLVQLFSSALMFVSVVVMMIVINSVAVKLLRKVGT